MGFFFRAKSCLFLFSLVLVSPLFAISAEDVIKEAVLKSQNVNNLSEIITYVENSIDNITSDAEARSLYTFLGQLNEQAGIYKEACNWYAKAAGIPGSPVQGTIVLTSEQLVLAAIRSALSGGDYETAESYLSSIRSSKNPETAAFVRLYTAWAYLSRAETQDDLVEPIALLKSYATMSLMEPVRPAVYLTLWYITGDDSWKSKLSAEFPNAPEAAVTTSKAELLPSPFWFFLPQKEPTEFAQSSSSQNEVVAVSGKNDIQASDASTTQEEHVIICQQLGFFRSKENASRLMERVRAAGFEPELKEEIRASGTTYFVVTVPEDSSGNTGLKLKTAGFECYPVFAE